MNVACDECGKVVKKSPRELRRYKHHFCCRACYVKHRRKNKNWKLPRSNSMQGKLNEWADMRWKMDIKKHGIEYMIRKKESRND